MIIQSSIERTIGHVTDSLLYRGGLNWNHNRYQPNPIHIVNNDNSNNNVHISTD